MARVRYEEKEKYESTVNAGFLSLTNNGDTAHVRFLYESEEDIYAITVHKVEMAGGKNRYIECFKHYDEPVDVCPFCQEQYSRSLKMFIPVYDVEEQKVKIWERGQTYFDILMELYRQNAPIISNVFEIVRNGEKGDINTKYEIFLLNRDDEDYVTTIDMFELPDIDGSESSLVIAKTYEQMKTFVQTGSFAEDIRKRETPSMTREEYRRGNNNGVTTSMRQREASTKPETSTPPTRGKRF